MSSRRVTAQGENILAYLERAITSREHTATEAAVEYGTEWYYDDGLVLARHEDDMVATGSQDFLERPQGEHIALNDPASVLRRCAADRKLIDLYRSYMSEPQQGHYADAGDRAMRQERTRPALDVLRPVLRALAEGYGWTEGER